MIQKLSPLALLAASLLLANCSKLKSAAEAPQNGAEVKGQVFIIQKNRVNLKLGGVEILYVPRAVFEQRCRWIKDGIPKIRQIADYENELDYIDAALEEASIGKHSGKIRDLLSTAKDRQLDARKRFEEAPGFRNYRLVLEARDYAREIFEDADFGDNDEEDWALAALFIEWLKDHVAASTQTDADGNYSLTLPPGEDGFLFVSSSRQLGKGEHESYFWIQKVPSSNPGPLHLSTNNQLTPSALKNFIGTSAGPDGAPKGNIVKEYNLRDLTWYTEAEELIQQIAANEENVAKRKTQMKKVEEEIEKAKYMDMGSE